MANISGKKCATSFPGLPPKKENRVVQGVFGREHTINQKVQEITGIEIKDLSNFDAVVSSINKLKLSPRQRYIAFSYIRQSLKEGHEKVSADFEQYNYDEIISNVAMANRRTGDILQIEFLNDEEASLEIITKHGQRFSKVIKTPSLDSLKRNLPPIPFEPEDALGTTMGTIVGMMFMMAEETPLLIIGGILASSMPLCMGYACVHKGLVFLGHRRAVRHLMAEAKQGKTIRVSNRIFQNLLQTLSPALKKEKEEAILNTVKLELRPRKLGSKI